MADKSLEYFSKIISRVRNVSEEKIKNRRNEIAISILRRLILESPVYTGTYANAHTLYIDNIPLRFPVVYLRPIISSDDIASDKIHELAMRKLALLNIETLEKSTLNALSLKNRISIGFDENVVYWGDDYYVESKYHVYEQVRRMYRSITTGVFTYGSNIVSHEFSVNFKEDGEYEVVEKGSTSKYVKTNYRKIYLSKHSEVSGPDSFETLIARIENEIYDERWKRYK